MKYTIEQVLNLLSEVTDNPQGVLDNWSMKKSNIPLNLDDYKYPLFLYSFPVELEGEVVATITLAQISHTGIDGQRDELISKYLGSDTYNKSWWAYSHESYLDCYLTIHKEFQLPAHPKDDSFRVLESHFLDDKGKEIKYRLSYGDTEVEGLYEQWVDDSRWSNWRCYRFDNGVNLQVEAIDIEGWLMGEKINEVIKVRIRDQKIDKLNDSIPSN